MVVKIELMMKKVTKKRNDELRKLEELIDNAVMRDFDGGDVNLYGLEYPDEKVLKELKKIYRDAGWNLFDKYDSMNGSYYFVLSPRGRR
jgi:hypothetical protein